MNVAKYIGRDCELSTTGEGAGGRGLESFDVAQAVLAQVDAAFAPRGFTTWTRSAGCDWNGSGQRRWRAGDRGSPYSSDCLRHWAPNGQSYYSDMGHVEVCTGSALRPRRFAAECLSTLKVAEAARCRAEELAPAGTQYFLSAQNADLADPSVSWGAHLNATVSIELWEDLFEDPRHPATLGFVASALAAAIPFFGAGYLMPLKDGTVIYSLSGRAHHISRIKSHTTTEAFRRGFLNSRREPHARGVERLHIIGFDFNLLSAALMGSFVQCFLAAAEQGFCGLNLYDPVRALRSWAWGLEPGDGTMRRPAALVDGRELSLPAYLREMTAALLDMVRAGQITDETAPEAEEHLSRIVELTERAERGEVRECARHLDWAAKLFYLMDLSNQEGLKLGDAATRLADHDFTSTDPERGAFWRLWERDLVDPLVSAAEVDACLCDGAPESRCWGRGRLIQRFHAELTDVDWGYVELRLSTDRWGERLRIEMPRLGSLNKQSFERVLAEASAPAELAKLIREDEGVVAEAADPLVDIRSQLASGREKRETTWRREDPPEATSGGATES